MIKVKQEESCRGMFTLLLLMACVCQTWQIGVAIASQAKASLHLLDMGQLRNSLSAISFDEMELLNDSDGEKAKQLSHSWAERR